MTIQVRDLQARFLRYFMVLYETRSITQAAEKLCITQPALSNSVRTLENQLKVILFDRTPQGIAPTVYADALYRRAKTAEAELRLATVEMERLRNSDVGSVRLGLGSSMVAVCAELLPRVLAVKPRLDVKIVEGPARFLMDQISTGRLDFVVCTIPHGVSYPDLDLRFVRNLPIVAVARHDHPLSGQKLQRSDLAAFPWIVADSALESSTEDLMRVFANHLPVTVASTNSPSMMRATIARSDFIGFMPRIMLAKNGNGRSQPLKALDLVGGIYERHLFVITRNGSFLPPASAYIVSEFRQAIELIEEE